MKRVFIALFAGLLWMGCGSPGPDPVEQPDPTPVPEDIGTPSEPAADSWEAFWGDFQTAVAADDKEKVKSMTAFSEHLSEKDFEDGYEVFFGDELKGVIAKTTAADVESNEGGAVKVEDPRLIVWEESAIVDGEEMGSALFVYFGKLDGMYRMVFWMAAG